MLLSSGDWTPAAGLVRVAVPYGVEPLLLALLVLTPVPEMYVAVCTSAGMFP